MHKLTLLILLLPCFSVCEQFTTGQRDVIIYPDSVWKLIDDAAGQGWNKDSLQKLKTYITDGTNATGMLVIKSGEILFNYGDIEEISYISLPAGKVFFQCCMAPSFTIMPSTWIRG